MSIASAAEAAYVASLNGMAEAMAPPKQTSQCLSKYALWASLTPYCLAVQQFSPTNSTTNQRRLCRWCGRIVLLHDNGAGGRAE
jgi:hypothetical protein